MIRRLYVHNFRCLNNFDLSIGDKASALLIGANGSGKTTISRALEILQKIARGTNRVGELVKPSELNRTLLDSPFRLSIQVELESGVFDYELALDLPPGFRELRVREEKLACNGAPLFSRETASVRLGRSTNAAAEFRIDWHLIALPIVQERSGDDPLSIFKKWLGRMLILRPIPGLMTGDSNEETLYPSVDVSNFAAWFSGLLAEAPAAYTRIDSYLKQVMSDLKDLQNPTTGKDSRSLTVNFSSEMGSIPIPFGDLSDGEKCFMVCSLVLAAKEAYPSTFCFWDEPDSYLALSEVGHFVIALRSAFKTGGQLIVTSHNPEAIRKFSEDNTFFLHRKSHLEPTLIHPVSELTVRGNLVDALVRGDVEP